MAKFAAIQRDATRFSLLEGNSSPLCRFAFYDSAKPDCRKNLRMRALVDLISVLGYLVLVCLFRFVTMHGKTCLWDQPVSGPRFSGRV